MCAPRARACSYSSTTSAAAPSPITKPSRVRSNGRHARAAGSPSHWLIVLMMANALYVSGLKRGFRRARHDHVRPAVADVAQRLTDGHRAAGAGVGIGRADPAQAVFDGDVRVGRPAEDLQGERLVDAARAFLEEVRVLSLGVGDAAERGAEAHPDAGLRSVRRIREARVAQRQPRAGHRELRVAVQPLEPVRREEFGGIPVADFARVVRVVLAGIEPGQPRDAAALRAQAVPERLLADAHAGDGTQPRDDRAPGHTAPASASRCAFMQRRVWLAM